MSTFTLAACKPSIAQSSSDFTLGSDGKYKVSMGNWQFAGTLGSVGPTRVTSGDDDLGKYVETKATIEDGEQITVKSYHDLGAVVFDLAYPKGASGSGIAFPDFTTLPKGLSKFSFRDVNFSRPAFGINQTCTPWLCFDSSDHAYIFSPASNFMVAKLNGDAETEEASALNDKLEGVPPGFHQTSVLVAADGINKTWSKWGEVLQKLYHKHSPGNEADLLLRKFGYWTDNGADYYYNYEPDLGYAGTLLALRKRYQEEGIPLGYMQLDSWWYDKSIYDAEGKPGGAMKNSKLPKGDWNRYGGTMSYRADKDLFPNGLAAFHDQLGLPLAVHNRWIDRTSPYHEKYKFSDVAAIDPAWWNEIDSYLASSGVVLYEQDWLDHIYNYSPELHDTVGPADAFTGGMAAAAKSHGLDLQYCMATPRFFMQGVEYPNLTNIRTSDDRFDPGKWPDFLYVSQLARAMGIWPWCDVFKSSETGNMIMSVLSAGPVGTGDKMGAEDKENILKAALPDGTIVKPDASLLPIDQTYIDQAAHEDAPFVAATYTGGGDTRTAYVFAFARSEKALEAKVPLAQIGVSGRTYVYDPEAGSGSYLDPTGPLKQDISSGGYKFLEFAPVFSGDVVILGDLGKFVATGRQRLEMKTTSNGVQITVHFAPGEREVVISGMSPKSPTVNGAAAKLAKWDSASGRFEVAVQANGQTEQVFNVSG